MTEESHLLLRTREERDAAWRELADLRAAILHLRSLDYYEIIPRDEAEYKAAEASLELALRRRLPGEL